MATINLKPVFLTIISILFALSVFSQDTTDKESSEYFVVLYTIGANWDTTKPAHEQLYFKEHSLHLSALRKSKKIDIGGRYSDKGMIILKVRDENEAKTLITKDKAVQNEIFKTEIFPFSPFYKGCIE